MHIQTSSASSWSDFQKIAFRFTFLFILLFIAVFNNGAYPFWNYLMVLPDQVLHTLIPWLAENILHTQAPVSLNGSGDTTYSYVLLLTVAVVALVGTALWTGFDRKRNHYEALYYWLTVAVRFYVGLMLFNYGLWKLFKLQFPTPSLYRLTQTYGGSSPMGLAWSFLGFSVGYNIFMGIAEVAALLLLFRRTLVLGALITLTVTVNIMAVNYFYDVPVKMISTALVTMTVFLLLRDAKRIVAFFLSGTSVHLPPMETPAAAKRYRIPLLSLKWLIIGSFVVLSTIEVIQIHELRYSSPTPFFGVYQVDYVREEKSSAESGVPPESGAWQQIIIERKGFLWVRLKGDRAERYAAQFDTIQHKIELTLFSDNAKKCAFSYTAQDNQLLSLNGTLHGDTVSLVTRLQVNEVAGFPLLSRGFHWVNEEPYNK